MKGDSGLMTLGHYGNNHHVEIIENINTSQRKGIFVTTMEAVKAAVSQAIVSTGLHPSLGLRHHNQYNSFCLSDDLVEPLRPATDIRAYEIYKKFPDELKLTIDVKHTLLNVLSQQFKLNKKSLPLTVALHYYTASVKEQYAEKIKG